MPPKIIFAAFHPDGPFLGMGIARSPLHEDLHALHRMQHRFGGIPDVLILEEFPAGKPWAVARKMWGLRVRHAKNIYSDKMKPDSWNLRVQKERWAELLEGREYLTGADLLSRRRQVLVPLPRSEAPATGASARSSTSRAASRSD